MDTSSILIFKDIQDVNGVSIDDPMLTPDSFYVVDPSNDEDTLVPFHWEDCLYYWKYVKPAQILEFKNTKVLVSNPYTIVVDKSSGEISPYQNKELNDILQHYSLIEEC